MRDGEIRHALLVRLTDEHAGDANTRIWPELSLCLGEARVDVGVVNGSLAGYEIKSASDRLTRLPSQRQVYERSLDFITMVTERRWADAVLEHIPEWWGLLVVRQSAGSAVTFDEVRAPARNIDLDPLALAQLLWRDEAAALVTARGICERTSRLTRWQLWDLLVEHMSIDDLSKTVREHLRARPDRGASGLPMQGGARSRLSAR